MSRPVAALLVATALSAALTATGEADGGGRPAPDEAGAQRPLDELFAAYVSGEADVVARTFPHSRSFEPLRLTNPRAIERWLGPWQRQKAALLLDMAHQSMRVAPAYTTMLLEAGQRYFLRRARTPESATPDDEFERLWHQIAIGLLHGKRAPDLLERYIDASRRAPQPASTTAPRILLALAIGQEQRCWDGRPDLVRSGVRLDAVARASGASTSPLMRQRASDVAAAGSGHTACLVEALARFTAAAAVAASAAESRVRAAWILFQLGRFEDARRSLEDAPRTDDPELTYLAALFRARIDVALDQPADAEHAFRAALAARPDAQSAAVGLALVLARLDRAVEAEQAAQSVRTRAAAAVDPWWTYMDGDYRFVAGWMAEIRSPR